VSVISIPYILLGAIYGVKIWMLIVLFGGGMGMFFAARWWMGLSCPFAFFSAAAYMASQWLPARAMSGNYDETTLITAPLALALLHGLLNRRWYGYLLPLYYSTLFAQAKYGPFIIGAMVFIFAVIWGLRSWRHFGYAMLVWILSFGFGVLLSLPKLIPLLDLMHLDLVDQAQYAGVKNYDSWGEMMLHAVGNKYDEFRTPSQVVGFGMMVFVLAAMAQALAFRKGLPWTLSIVMGALVTLGERSPVPVLLVMSKIPFFESMNSVAKYWNLPILVGVAGLSGLALERLFLRLEIFPGKTGEPPGRHSPASIPPLVQKVFAQDPVSGRFQRPPRLYVAAPLYIFAFWFVMAEPADYTKSAFGDLFREHMTDLPQAEEFYHVASPSLINDIDRYRLLPENERTPMTDQFHNIVRGIGTITWYGNFVYPEHAVPRFYLIGDEAHPNPDYLGEVYIADGDRAVSDIRVTYNTVSFDVAAGDGELAVVNQNFYPGWRSNEGEVIDHDGVIGVRVPGSFSGRVTLRFINSAFRTGLLLAVISAVIWFGGAWWVLRRIAPEERPAT
jgi:hypothetical protein